MTLERPDAGETMTRRRVAVCSALAAAAVAGAFISGAAALRVAHGSPGAPPATPTLHSYHTEFGAIRFYNPGGRWPVMKRIKFRGVWHLCAFWRRRFDCAPAAAAKTGGDGDGS